MAGQAVDIELQDMAITEEMEVSSLVMQHRVYTWIDISPLPEGDDTFFPQGFLDGQRVLLHRLVQNALHTSDDEDNEQGIIGHMGWTM